MNSDLLIAGLLALLLHAAAVVAIGDPRSPPRARVTPGTSLVIHLATGRDDRVPRLPADPTRLSSPPLAIAAVPEPHARIEPRRPHQVTPGRTDPGRETTLEPLAASMPRGVGGLARAGTVRSASPAATLPPPPPPAAPPPRVAVVTPPAEAPPPARRAGEHPPVPLVNDPPPYPTVARRRGAEGVVELDVLVLADGACGEIEVRSSSGHRALDRAAIRAVRRWRFEPATVRGVPVERWVTIPIEFKLLR